MPFYEIKDLERLAVNEALDLILKTRSDEDENISRWNKLRMTRPLPGRGGEIPPVQRRPALVHTSLGQFAGGHVNQRRRFKREEEKTISVPQPPRDEEPGTLSHT
ncbi:unnamed protein product [Pleuronectes platessa]|uniref:Uncharacterized protein n=1 Tax=Pleuronectes platessa TaxID=8262 RepID=A0A9N7Z3Z5_PLEPL|nr:unnamed protein product [Pleuronectes platessa]